MVWFNGVDAGGEIVSEKVRIKIKLGPNRDGKCCHFFTSDRNGLKGLLTYSTFSNPLDLSQTPHNHIIAIIFDNLISAK